HKTSDQNISTQDNDDDDPKVRTSQLKIMMTMIYQGQNTQLKIMMMMMIQGQNISTQDNDDDLKESKYLVAVNMLLIRDARASDAGEYSCLARHDVTAVTKRSPPARLTVAENEWEARSGLTLAREDVVEVAAGSALCLPCVAPLHPQPRYSWYLTRGSQVEAVVERGEVGSWAGGEAGSWAWAGGAALCVRAAAAAHDGAWLCKAEAAGTDASERTLLIVRGALTVSVEPPLIVAASGSTVQLNCSASVQARLWWLHDGAFLNAAASPRLLLLTAAHRHRGLYQCFAARSGEQAHAQAELRLAGQSAELAFPASTAEPTAASTSASRPAAASRRTRRPSCGWQCFAARSGEQAHAQAELRLAGQSAELAFPASTAEPTAASTSASQLR
ncbi:hypothetical protein ACJJTC_000144, partial [Scirpophaga incertulas]